ncbi:MAG: hypothetical protein A3F69_03345 [Acidobacteria bacterium RIFCSPLOWO2_12_FULL_66_10]|nr:MAG: hypothetical protein A3F69_03345 [Acidobacteria bacterium RIFCSPLOWO2_12_FULL_66_10]
MYIASPLRQTSKRFLIATVLVLLAATVAVRRTDAQSQPSKLTSVLADLVQATERGQLVAAPGASLTSAQSIDALPRSVRDAMGGGWLRVDDNGAVQVYVLLRAVNDDTVGRLTAAGATIEIADVQRRRVQARVPVSRLRSVAQLPIVDAIRLPSYARRRSGIFNTEGDAIVRADAARQQLRLDGTGVRVGVISDGLKGVFAVDCTSCGGVAAGPIEGGDLPAATGVRNAKGVLTAAAGGIVARSFSANNDLEGLPPTTPACGFAGAGAEGTALLEIVHDLAPGAKLSFANFDTDLAFNQAVNFLAASNDVVIDDIGFYGEPSDGTSAASTNTAAALNNTGFPIRAYFTSVGNDADKHYYGAYADSGVEGTSISGITTPGHLHLFQRTADTTDVLGLGAQAYNLIRLPQNGEVAIFLTWNDAFGASGNNYDLYLVQQSTGQVVARGTDVQTGRQDPSEFIDYVNRGAADSFRIIVQNVRGGAQPRDLNIFSFQPECATGGPQLLAAGRHERHNYNTATRSVIAQSDAGGSPGAVVSVGAICSASAAAAGQFSPDTQNESCLDTSNRTVEFFSSQGPTLDGRVKPDVAAIDGVSVSGAGGIGTPFFGTSAAAPHLAGVAALLLQSAPCLLGRATSTVAASAARGTVRNLLLGNAVKLGGSTPNNTFGAGRVDALAAIQRTLPTWKGSANLTFDGTSPFGANLTGSQLGFVDPNGCGLTALTWSGGCGTSPGSTMTCGFGASSVSVAASNNGVGFGASANLRITVTDFSVDVSPTSVTVPAGRSARFVVTVAPRSGSFKSEVALSCANGNLPPQVTCSFDPPTVTPGTGSARSILTITTTASAVLPPMNLKLPEPPAGAGPSLGAPTVLLAWPAALATLWFALRRPNGRRAVARAAWALASCGVAGLVVYAGSNVVSPVLAAAPVAGIAVFPAGVIFPSQTVGTTTPPSLVYITNTGDEVLSIRSILSAGDFSLVTSCGSTLAAGGNCAVAVSFTPTATGARTGSLSIFDSASGSPRTVALAGTGLAVPSGTGGTPSGGYSLTISGTSGTLTHSSPVTLTVP